MAERLTCRQCGHAFDIGILKDTQLRCPQCGNAVNVDDSSANEVQEVLEVTPADEGILEVQAVSDQAMPAEVLEVTPADQAILEALAASDQDKPADLQWPSTQGPFPFAYWSAQLRTGITIQYGFAVLRPQYVAFLPSGKRTNLAMSVVGAGVSSATGIQAVDLGGLFKYRTWWGLRRMVERLGFEEFDAFVRKEVRRVKGVWWPLDQVSPSWESNPLLRRWDMIVFNVEDTLIRGIPSKKDKAFIEQVIHAKMGDTPLPTKHPYLLWTIIAALPTLIAAVGIYQSLGAKGGERVFGLICASVIGALAVFAWACAIRTYYRMIRRIR